MYLSSNICKITQTLYSDCYKIALLMTMSTLKYNINNKFKVFFNLPGIVWNGQLMEEISIH
ncbi:hypothetical protein NMY3_01998 [Candidatus Nitrosocosmicus oleophilus]|uniref:Uncharacterized protein n=1 Tax=Candidatus Nitrosocosmicus oleophilus TaxID=1353260 RepID=A0A654LZI9_9ARCH|nr:hypothetical protein NMY3_01998 [Candidatus Nitrosocosmicus oleophilus]